MSTDAPPPPAEGSPPPQPPQLRQPGGKPPSAYRPDLRPMLVLAGLLVLVILGWIVLSPLILPPAVR
jgi:hypothetical protein